MTVFVGNSAFPILATAGALVEHLVALGKRKGKRAASAGNGELNRRRQKRPPFQMARNGKIGRIPEDFSRAVTT